MVVSGGLIVLSSEHKCPAGTSSPSAKQEPPPPVTGPSVQIIVYSVVAPGETATEPEVAPPVEKLPAHVVAPVEDHVRSDDSPFSIEAGFATRAAVMTAAGVVTRGVVGATGPAKYLP
jgi:hypothetical protein